MAKTDPPVPTESSPVEDSPKSGAIQADYQMLAEMIRHQHDRFKDHTTVFMSILSALLGFIVWFIAKQTRISVAPKYALILLASCGGFAASLAWFLVMRRILVDTKLRYFQLHYCERAMTRPYGMFSEGQRFFEKGIRRTTTPDGQTLTFEDCLGRCPVKTTMQFLAGGYSLVFLLFAGLAIWKIGGAL